MRLTLPATSLLLLACFATPGASNAAKSYDSCTGYVTSVPALITTQGNWCLSADISTSITSGSAIVIATNNVTLDCNDFKLGGLGGGPDTAANGVVAMDRLNITLRNCSIRGFLHGVYLNGGGGHLVEDNAFDRNRYAAIRVVGDGSTIRRNRALNTGSTTVSTQAAFGIVTNGTMDILDNVVNSVLPYSATGTAYGIYSNVNVSGNIRRNLVRNLFAQDSSNVRAIHAVNSTRVVIQDNIVQNSNPTGGVGVYCAAATGTARGNVASGFTTGVDGCTSSGNFTLAP